MRVGVGLVPPGPYLVDDSASDLPDLAIPGPT
jgi:hypothetical protein